MLAIPCGKIAKALKDGESGKDGVAVSDYFVGILSAASL
jgi:hypothetical protein